MSLSKLRRYPIGNLGQGMMMDINPVEAPPGSCVVGTLNVVQVDGWLQARAGFLPIQQLPVAERVHKLMPHQDLAGNIYLCALSLNTTTGVGTLWESSGGVWNNAGTIPAGQLSANVPITNANYAGVTYFTTGVGDIWYFDPQNYWSSGIPLATLNFLQANPAFDCPTAVKLLVAADSRLIVANYTYGGVPTPYGIQWSDFNILDVWGGALANAGGDSGGTALPKNSDPVSGLYVNSSVMTVFRPREMYIGVEVGSPAVYITSCFDQGPGCVAHATIQPYRDGAIVWLGDDNVYIGAPGQTPQPLGDHIRLRIRQVANLSKMDQSKALLDYDHQLYALFLPDTASGKCDRMFTCNLRTGGWWESQIADPAMDITDAIAYRVNPWQTLNIVGTTDGRVLQFLLGYAQDDQTPFQCAWQSSILSPALLASKVLNMQGHYSQDEQVSVQTMRVIGQNIATATGQVQFQILHGDNIENMQPLSVGETQILAGAQDIFSTSRITNENFQLLVYSPNANNFPKICQVEIGGISQGKLR